MIKAVKKLPFLVNLLITLGLAFLIIFLLLKMLGWFTKHGEQLVVPNVLHKDTKQAIQFLESKGFDVEITDSAYTDTAKSGIVLKQIPDANSTVKVNRTVFLVVNRYTPPLLDMPKLEGLSMAFAIEQLERNHLKLGDTLFKPDFAIGSVIDQQYNGVKIKPGDKIQWGSKITLIIASGQGGQFLVPDVLGLTFAQASKRLDSLGILPIPVPGDPSIKDSTDYNSAYVVSQRPSRFDEVGTPIYLRSGMVMDLTISKYNVIRKDSVAIPKASEKFLNEQAIKEAEEQLKRKKQADLEKQKEKKNNTNPKTKTE